MSVSFTLCDELHPLYTLLAVCHHICMNDSPLNLSFPEDQVNQEGQEDPKAGRHKDRERSRQLERNINRKRGVSGEKKKDETVCVNGKR